MNESAQWGSGRDAEMPCAAGHATPWPAMGELARSGRSIALQLGGAAALVLAWQVACREGDAPGTLLAASVAVGVVEGALAPIYFGGQRDALTAVGFSARSSDAARTSSWQLAVRALTAMVAAVVTRVIATALAALPGLGLGLVAKASGSVGLGAAAETVGAAACGVAFVVAGALTCLSSRIAVVEGTPAVDAVARSIDIVRRRWLAVLGALILTLSSTACAVGAPRFASLFILAVLIRWAADVTLTSTLLDRGRRRAERRERRRTRGLAHRLAPAMFALAFGIATLGRSDVALADASLITDSETVATSPPSGAPLEHPGPSLSLVSNGGIEVVTASSKPITVSASADPISAVVLARAQTDAALVRLQQARLHVREVALNNGDVEAAGRQLDLAQEELTRSSQGVRTALEANEATNRLLARAEELRVYGADGPTTAQRVGWGLLTGGGVLSGMGEGTVVGAKDAIVGLGQALYHPVDTVTAISTALTKPAPTAAEVAAQDTAALMRERAEKIAQVSQPFEVAHEGGHLVGYVMVGPSVAGEAIGLAASALKTPLRLLREGAPRAVPIEAVSAETVGGRQTVAREYYLATPGFDDARFAKHATGIDFSKDVQVVKVPKGTIVYQWVDPKVGIGRYFSYELVKPEALGIAPGGRVLKRFVVSEDVEALRTTAAPIIDTWTVPDQTIPLPGGGTQLYVRSKDVMRAAE